MKSGKKRGLVDYWIIGLMSYEKEYQITRVSDGEGQISENQKKSSDNLNSEISF